jgi:hypothetical protein
LPNGRSIRCIATRCDVIDFEHHEITTTQLTIDSEIKQRQVANAAFDLKPSPDGPDVLGAKRRLRSNDLSLIPWNTLRDGFDDV